MVAATGNAPARAALPDSVVVIDGGRVHVESDAILAIARRLGFPYSLAGVFRLLPRAIRDGLYRYVARNRYRWFGRIDQGPDHCPVPTPEERARLLPDDEMSERPASS